MRIEQLRQEFSFELKPRVFPLHPETPEEGQTLTDLFAGQVDVPSMLYRLRQVADELGLPFGQRTHTYNSRRLQELGKWAQEQGLHEAFCTAAYRAYFAEGKNIAQSDVLLELAESVGLDRDRASQVLSESCYGTAVDDDWARARSLGVTAVPTFICEDRRLVGFHPYERFRHLLTG